MYTKQIERSETDKQHQRLEEYKLWGFSPNLSLFYNTSTGIQEPLVTNSYRHTQNNLEQPSLSQTQLVVHGQPT